MLDCLSSIFYPLSSILDPRFSILPRITALHLASVFQRLCPITRTTGNRLSPRSSAMSPQLSGKIRQEVDLIARFAESYRREFSSLIDRLNVDHDASTDL